MSEVPTISIDRAVRYYVEDIDIDTGKLSNFYDQLAYDNKPSLADCHIHVSALGMAISKRVTYGHRFDDKNHAPGFDSLAPPSDILIYLGSIMSSSEFTLSEVIAHELVHYAQGPEDKPGASQIESEDAKKETEQEKILTGKLLWNTSPRLRALRFILKSSLSVGGLYVLESAAGYSLDFKHNLAGAVGGTAGAEYLNRKKRKKEVDEIQTQLQAIYEKKPDEIEARDYTVIDESAATYIPMRPMPQVINMTGGMPASLNNFMHREFSSGRQTPPIRKK